MFTIFWFCHASDSIARYTAKWNGRSARAGVKISPPTDSCIILKSNFKKSLSKGKGALAMLDDKNWKFLFSSRVFSHIVDNRRILSRESESLPKRLIGIFWYKKWCSWMVRQTFGLIFFLMIWNGHYVINIAEKNHSIALYRSDLWSNSSFLPLRTSTISKTEAFVEW